MNKTSVTSSLWEDVIQNEDTARHDWVADSSAPLGYSAGTKVLLSWDTENQSMPVDATGERVYSKLEILDVLATADWSPAM